MENVQPDFFMRDPIRIRILTRIEALEKGYRQNIGLIGSPGLGKTQVLSSIFRTLSQNSPQIVPVYVDARALDYELFVHRWIGALLTGLFIHQEVQPPPNFQSLLNAAEPILPKSVEKILQLKKMMRQEKNAASVRDLFALTGVLAEETGKKIVLMIDEFHALAALPAPDPFAILGREMMVEKNTLYLVASSNPNRAREIFREKLSLLFGNFEVIDFAPFGFLETVQFLEKRLPGRIFSEAQQKFLIRMTNGSPVYLEYLIDRFEAILRQERESDVFYVPEAKTISDPSLLKAVHHEIFDEKGRIALHFEKRLEVYRHWSKDGSPYLRALLALSHGRRKALAIAAYMEKKMPETKKILQRLVEEAIIEKRGSFYRLEDPLFQFWLKEVYFRKNQRYTPEEAPARVRLAEALREEFRKMESEQPLDIMSRVEALFKEFRNDVIEIEEKKFICPQFSEIVFRPSSAKALPLLARNSRVRWLCQISRQIVREEDVAFFLEESKRFRKKLQRKIFIALAGMDQNARLMAQEAGIQIWSLRTFNCLLDLYGLPKIIFISEKENKGVSLVTENAAMKEEDGSSLGALAQSVYSA